MGWDDKFDWYMQRFGKSISMEIACAIFGLIECGVDERHVLDDIRISISLVKHE